MRALLAYKDNVAPVLQDVSPPPLRPADVRIEVAAAAVNPVDVGVATGRGAGGIRLPDPIGLGWDVSGTVTEVGSDVPGLRPGDPVAGVLNVIGLQPSVGTHADTTVLPAAAVARVPEGLDLIEAASLPLNALTARQALALLGPAEGRSLLITGGAGAVGGYAIVLAARAGWQVSALARFGDAEFVAGAGANPVTDMPYEHLTLCSMRQCCSSQRWALSATVDPSSAWRLLRRLPASGESPSARSWWCRRAAETAGTLDSRSRKSWGVPMILDRDSQLRGSVHARATPEVQPAVQG